MKKTLAILMTALVSSSLCAFSASAVSMQNGLAGEPEVAFCKASVPVQMDGVISPGEYLPIEVSGKDFFDGGVYQIGWDSGSVSLSEAANEMAVNTTFYVSYSDTTLNFAATTILPDSLKDIKQEFSPAEVVDGNKSEAFLRTYGFAVRISGNDEDDPDPTKEDFYRAFSINENGEGLEGYWRDYGFNGRDGSMSDFDGNSQFIMGTNYYVLRNGRELTFECAVPFGAAGVKFEEGSKFKFDLSVAAGEDRPEDAKTGVNRGMCVSYSDDGIYTSVRYLIDDDPTLERGRGYITMETISADPGTTDPGTTNPGTTDPGTSDPGTTDPGTSDPGTTDPGTTTPGTTDPGTTDPGTTDPGTTTPGTTDPGTTTPGTTTPGTTTPGTTTPGTTTPGTTTPGNNGGTNNNGGNRNPQTGDAVMILAAVSALSAVGTMIFRKRR